MKQIFDNVSAKCSEIVTKEYSTSFSLGIKFLDKKMHEPIYGIYGFVRFADEIVDSFHDYDKRKILEKFKDETITAISDRISINPILNSFQKVVNYYKIEWELIEAFFTSMEMDLDQIKYNQNNYLSYILGSAEVVGLMCLRVFVEGNDEIYKKLKPYAKSLGSAFQKVNFLRDVKADFEILGRVYFPEVNIKSFDAQSKRKIEEDIEKDFKHALIGIKQLSPDCRKGVYLAYHYYKNLFNKIKALPAQKVLNERIRIPDAQKFVLMFASMVRHQLNML